MMSIFVILSQSSAVAEQNHYGARPHHRSGDNEMELTVSGIVMHASSKPDDSTQDLQHQGNGAFAEYMADLKCVLECFLRDYSSLRDKYSYGEGDHFLAHMLKDIYRSGHPLSELERCEIIIYLWILKETDFLQNIWWQTEDSQTRVLIMALFLCQKGDFDASRGIASFYVPPFYRYSQRFSSEEAKLRVTEWNTLSDNASELRRTLLPVIRQFPN